MQLNPFAVSAIERHPFVIAELTHRAEKVAEYWQELTDGAFEHQREHVSTGTRAGTYVEHPGDYEKAIRVVPVGVEKVRVVNTDPKAYMLEYGTSKMPPKAFAAQVKEHFE